MNRKQFPKIVDEALFNDLMEFGNKRLHEMKSNCSSAESLRQKLKASVLSNSVCDCPSCYMQFMLSASIHTALDSIINEIPNSCEEGVVILLEKMHELMMEGTDKEAIAESVGNVIKRMLGDPLIASIPVKKGEMPTKDEIAEALSLALSKDSGTVH